MDRIVFWYMFNEDRRFNETVEEKSEQERKKKKQWWDETDWGHKFSSET